MLRNSPLQGPSSNRETSNLDKHCTTRGHAMYYDNRIEWIFDKVCGHLSAHGDSTLRLVRQFGQYSAASACTGTTAEQHARSHQHSSPLSCLSASTGTYTITVSPPPLLLPPPPSPFTTTATTTTADTSTTVRNLHHHHHHVRPAPAPERRRAPRFQRYESVGRHEPRVLGLLVFIRS